MSPRESLGSGTSSKLKSTVGVRLDDEDLQARVIKLKDVVAKGNAGVKEESRSEQTSESSQVSKSTAGGGAPEGAGETGGKFLRLQ